MGLPAGVAPEELLFEAPERVIELHRRFLDAGSEIVLTCSFGGTSLRLADGQLAGRAVEVNRRAAELARHAVDAEALVAGSMGPSGQLIEPYGTLTRGQCVKAYAEQAAALTAGGADLLVLETFFALEEAQWAIEGAHDASGLPLVVCFSFDQGTRTMMGLSPAEAVAALDQAGLAALGLNCGRSLTDTDQLVDAFLATGTSLPLWVKPNAGVPRVVGDNVIYEADPETLAQHLVTYLEHGARIVGGCCGTTPEHIAILARTISPAWRQPADRTASRRR
jgi:5-methyltetrahydrofolate--homocysteine methyltransferase